MDGVIATNTTITRPATLKSNNANEQGGLSGAPLKTISNQTLKTLAQALQGSIPIIAVGGVMSLADAHEKLNLGASLVQVYSGLVYRGLDLLRELLGDE
jgi:dihydroorotate dehydrogenase